MNMTPDALQSAVLTTSRRKQTFTLKPLKYLRNLWTHFVIHISKTKHRSWDKTLSSHTPFDTRTQNPWDVINRRIKILSLVTCHQDIFANTARRCYRTLYLYLKQKIVSTEVCPTAQISWWQQFTRVEVASAWQKAKTLALSIERSRRPDAFYKTSYT